MTAFQVEVLRTIACTVTVQADTPEEAKNIVDQADFPLPDPYEWTSLDGWEYVVYADGGDEELYRE